MNGERITAVLPTAFEIYPGGGVGNGRSAQKVAANLQLIYRWGGEVLWS
ncbi:MAG: hypothetical protein R6X34_15630 [Chloroflexota bacterium]